MPMRTSVAGLLLVACCASVAQANVRLPAILGDHMVLQQGVKVPVWGWAEPGEKVTVEAAGQKVSTTTGADGRWRVDLEALKATGEPIEVKVSGKNTLTLKDVLVGEVWLCSGQSNMVWPLSATFSASEIPKANHPGIRLFKVGGKVAFEPQNDCEGKWVVCTPESVASFSGVGYFFGRELHETLRRPIGLIGSYGSASPAQAWTSLKTLRAHECLKEYVDHFEKIRANRVRIEEDYDKKYLPAWEAEHKKWIEECRKPYDQASQQWAADAKKAKAEGKPLPPKPELKPAPPKYGCPARRGDNPTVLHNGMIAPLMPFAIKGVIWYQGESNCHNPIQYRTLFPALITEWRQHWGQGDFPFLFVQLANNVGETSGVHLLREAQLRTLALPNTGMAVTIDIGEPLIHPRNKKDVGLRLALAARHVAYGQELVYSGPLYKGMKIEGDKVRLTFDHVGGGLVIASAPPARPGDVPAPPAAELKGFTMAGADKKFMPAQARIEQDTVVVWSGQVKEPVAVRLGWTEAPDVNLYNKEHLPASPFRTDDWK